MILIKHIQQCLPQMRASIDSQLAVCNSELLLLGESKFDKTTLLLDLLIKFCKTYSSAIQGNVSKIETVKLSGGANISNVFLKSFKSSIMEINALEGMSKDSVLIAMKNATGASPAMVPEIAFELLVKLEIGKLRDPCLQCVDLVHGELIAIVQSCLNDPDIGLSRFPKLKWEICDFVTSLLGKRVPVTKESVNNFIDIQLGFINKSHLDFNHKIHSMKKKIKENKNVPPSVHTINNQRKINNYRQLTEPEDLCEESDSDQSEYCDEIEAAQDTVTAKKTAKKLQDKSEKDYKLIVDLVNTYFEIVKKLIEDTIPKMVMHFLVHYSTQELQPLIIQKLYGLEIANFLDESSSIKEKRARLEKDVEALKQATHVLNRMEFCI